MLVLVLVLVIDSSHLLRKVVLTPVPFDHEKLNVYQVSLEFVALIYFLAEKLVGNQRHAKDQLLRASLSIPLNIAEGNGKRSILDRKRFWEIARGSAMECAAILDVLMAIGSVSEDGIKPSKDLLYRIVSMLSKMTEIRDEGVREKEAHYNPVISEGIDYDYEHEHEHEHEHEQNPCS